MPDIDKTKGSNPAGPEGSPENKKRSLMQKLRHPFKYRFQLKIVSSSDSTGDVDAHDTVAEDTAPSKADAKKAKAAKAKQAKKEKADKKAKAKKAKQEKAKQAKAAKKAKPKKTKKGKNGDEGGKKKIPLPLLIGALVLLLGGATTAILLTRSGPSIEKRLEKAEKYVASQKYDSAVKLYNELIAEEEIEEADVIEAYLGISDAYVGNDDVDSAVLKLEAGLQETGDERIEERLYQLAPEKEQEMQGAGSEGSGAEPAKLPGDTPVQFSDKGFDTMIRLALGKSAGETIYQKDLDEVRSLKILGGDYAEARLANGDASGTVAAVVHEHDHFSINGEAFYDRGDIRSLDDLAYFHNLTRLSIGYNQIDDISGISGAGSLNIVGLYANEITDLTPLQNLDKLQYLYLYNNNIRDLSPLSEMHSLKQLLVQYNNISDLSPLADLTELKELFVSYNNISDLSPVSGLDSLEQLFVSGNQISDITPIGNLQKLRFFYAQNNQISDISVIAKMSSLTDVDFSGNPVADYSPAASVVNVNRPLGLTRPY